MPSLSVEPWLNDRTLTGRDRILLPATAERFVERDPVGELCLTHLDELLLRGV